MTQRSYWNEGWLFSEKYCDDMLSDACEGMKEVRLPHTAKETPFHYFDESIYEMECCYIKKFSPQPQWQGKIVTLTFEGAAHGAYVYLNGTFIGEHHSGYTAFTVELQEHLRYDGENILTVRLDTRENQNIPPFGYVVDYMTYGGIYRDVYLEIKEPAHIIDVFVKSEISGNISFQENGDAPKMVRVADAKLIADVTLSTAANGLGVRFLLRKQMRDGSYEQPQLLGEERFAGTQKFSAKIKQVQLWDIDDPVLYELLSQLVDENGELVDERITRFGFRKAVFLEDGFYLNDRKVKIRGLNRHQSYPYVGYAMPKAPQILDARILKQELGVNAVRTSHYPQSHYFLDACDELGLLVFTEMVGWQHIGDGEWKEQAVTNVREMVTQYRNHPSIILWGVRINESADDEEFYLRTNEAAHALDDSRQTGGVRCIKKSQLLEDVYTYNDFVHVGTNEGCEKKQAITPDSSKPYLISEYAGHMFPTKSFDSEEHRVEHANRHANILNAVAQQEDIAGSFGWCMFDYNTHKDFGSGDRICYHGVMDMFRNPKLAAAVYACQSDGEDILELSSTMDIGEHPACNRGKTYIYTNAECVRMYKNDKLLREYVPSDSTWKNLEHGPILVDDFVGDALEQENFKPWQKKAIKELMNQVSLHGMDHLPASAVLKAARLMVFGKFKFSDAVTLYNKYVGDWGGESKVYRLEAIKDGKVVKTVVKDAFHEAKLNCRVDHTTLVEENSYDVATVRMRMGDENGNVLPFYDEPAELSVSGPIELIGPKVISFKGGMAGTYVKTTGTPGEARLSIRVGTIEQEIHFLCK
ncbi:MAG: glycoside hydrolase family 2 TIM barrel-domain containing protein [bacterium]|nr:glycoside hydrolase family 2 TIM barrel-domain containing protein [bacterium]